MRWAAAAASPQEIDELNILQASLRAMATAVTRVARTESRAQPRQSPEQVLSPEFFTELYGKPELDGVATGDYAVLVDGPYVPPDLVGVIEAEGMVGGDGKSASIAAASIIAKVRVVAVEISQVSLFAFHIYLRVCAPGKQVIRDWYMVHVLDAMYPVYGFSRHKGYPTAAHRSALVEHGPCPEHRHSYAPVSQAANKASAS